MAKTVHLPEHVVQEFLAAVEQSPQEAVGRPKKMNSDMKDLFIKVLIIGGGVLFCIFVGALFLKGLGAVIGLLAGMTATGAVSRTLG